MAKNSKSARVPLLGGAYRSRSLIAGAQRAVNLFPERTPEINQPPTPVVHMLTPGLLPLIQPVVGMVRGAYRATNGALFICVGVNVYFVNTDFSYTLCGTINPGTSIVSFADNGTTMVVVDGSADGWWLGLGSTVLTQISDPAFYGANFTCYLDGYLIFNRPATNQFYISPPFWNGTDPFDPLDIAAKIGGPDVIIAVTVMHREIWLIGQLTTEVWYNAGGADFPFERQPGVFIEHGMVRGWSIAQADVNIFWLGRDRQGQSIVLMGKDYNAFRVSNHALEDAIQSYGDVTNCVGFTYQQDGHTFFVLTFPAADKTWAYDLTTGEWHERVRPGHLYGRWDAYRAATRLPASSEGRQAAVVQELHRRHGSGHGAGPWPHEHGHASVERYCGPHMGKPCGIALREHGGLHPLHERAPLGNGPRPGLRTVLEPALQNRSPGSLD